MSDYMIRATAADKQIRAFAITSKELTEEARKRHNSSPIVTAAMGRLMSGSVMMGSMMKGENVLLTIQIKGDGPMRGLTVTADAKGNVKGYPYAPDVVLPANAMGKLDVGGAIGSGSMSVIKDMGLKEPYIGQIALQTGEIADDLTYYFAVSEQVPSSVGLGVLMSKENTVAQAGGFIIQLMPFTTDETNDKLEKKLAEVTSVTALLAQGYTPEMILDKLLGEFGLEITDKMPVQFHCDCSKERVEKAIASISKEELQSIIEDGEPIEVNCDFCNTKYKFDIDELKEILK